MPILFAFLLMIINSVAANVLLKLGAREPEASRIFFGFLGWKGVFGLGCFAVSGLTYSWVLRWMPLNVAQSLMTVQYIAVILACALLLGEVMTPFRLMGIALITAGIVLVSISYARGL
jgi:drug/metabolite transporter (DMT)-like permease